VGLVFVAPAWSRSTCTLRAVVNARTGRRHRTVSRDELGDGRLREVDLLLARARIRHVLHSSGQHGGVGRARGQMVHAPPTYVAMARWAGQVPPARALFRRRGRASEGVRVVDRAAVVRRVFGVSLSGWATAAKRLGAL
jgi:hypothetical protein